MVDLTVSPDRRAEISDLAAKLPSIQLTERQICDLELLATGAFSPLDRFMNQADHRSVLDEMRLISGVVFPIPISLSTNELPTKDKIALCNKKNEILAVMEIEDAYEWNKKETSEKVFGTSDTRHPLVAEMERWGKFNLSGKLQVLKLTEHFDFQTLRLSPDAVRKILKKKRPQAVVAFQTRNPLHRAHEAIIKQALAETDGILLFHPVVRLTKPDDIHYYTRVRSYRALIENYFDGQKVLLSLLPLAMRFAGPREALWHAIIRRNYGADHFIVGRDHATPGTDSNGKPFYSSDAAFRLSRKYSDEIGVKILNYDEFVYLPETEEYKEVSKLKSGTEFFTLSGTQVRKEFLQKGKRLPEWFTRPEVAEILCESIPVRHFQGVCLWLTGLSGSGKSTTAEILAARLPEFGRQVTLLDGDVVRTNLSKGLGFSKEDRDINVRRIGFVASEIVKHGGIAICAAISPYSSTRNDIRNLIGSEHFIEIFVNTPIEICEKRDVKGLYAKARKGFISDFTGIDAPYEPPVNPEIALDTENFSARQNADFILKYLREKGFLK